MECSEPAGVAIYSRTREAVAECRRSSSAKVLARLSENGRAREHDKRERTKVMEQQPPEVTRGR